eukprot:1161439-Pelagomonas_calceolata.AAC.4
MISLTLQKCKSKSDRCEQGGLQDEVHAVFLYHTRKLTQTLSCVIAVLVMRFKMSLMPFWCAETQQPYLQKVSVQAVYDFLLQRNNKLISIISKLMGIISHHNWMALPLRPLSVHGAPFSVPRYLHLDFGKRTLRNIARFRLHAHTLRVETSLRQTRSTNSGHGNAGCSALWTCFPKQLHLYCLDSQHLAATVNFDDEAAIVACYMIILDQSSANV